MDSEKKYNSYVPHLCYKGGNIFFQKKPHKKPKNQQKPNQDHTLTTFNSHIRYEW